VRGGGGGPGGIVVGAGPGGHGGRRSWGAGGRGKTRREILASVDAGARGLGGGKLKVGFSGGPRFGCSGGWGEGAGGGKTRTGERGVGMGSKGGGGGGGR